jgi:hypothetical protein
MVPSAPRGSRLREPDPTAVIGDGPRTDRENLEAYLIALATTPAPSVRASRIYPAEALLYQ